MNIQSLRIELPAEVQVILTQSHFIKTVENASECLLTVCRLSNMAQVVDCYKPKGIETEKDVIDRKHFLTKVGYKPEWRW